MDKKIRRNMSTEFKQKKNQKELKSKIRNSEL